MSAFAPLVGGKRTSISDYRTVVDLTFLVFHNRMLQISHMTLALSSEQLELLHGAADAVPLNWRARFLASVADLLTLVPDPSNRDVIEAVSAARRAMALGTAGPSGAEKPRRAPYARRRAAS
jgi:hypothetical protein